MSIRSRWVENLRCPQCGQTGVAKLSTTDDQSWGVRVDELPAGFKMARSGTYSNFFCVLCDRPAAP
jgi:hypothetical protein